MKRTLMVAALLLMVSPVFAQVDFTALEKDLADAKSFYEQALVIQKEKGEGGFLKACPYQKEFDEAKNRYYKIMSELGKMVSLRREIASNMDNMVTSAQWQSDFLEELVSIELTVLPQILSRNAIMSFNDIALGQDLFLPPLIVLPEKNYKKYSEALGSISATAPELAASTSPAPNLTLDDKIMDKTAVYKLMSSISAQKEYLSDRLTALDAKITALEALPQKEAAALYSLGNVYLLQEYYKRLSDCLYFYQQAQAMVPQITYTPIYKEMLGFRAKVNGVKVTGGLPSDEDLSLKNLNLLRDRAASNIECAKIPLPAGIEESLNPDDVYRFLNKYGNIISDERIVVYNQFKKLVNPIYCFNLFSMQGKIISTFEQAAALEPNNPYYHLRLANLYRMTALKDLLSYLEEANQYKIGFAWNNQPEYKYVPKDENAAIDLSIVKENLSKALLECQTVSKLSPQMGEKALGIYYLSLVPINPSYASQAGARVTSPGEECLLKVLNKVRTTTKTKERYTECVAMLEEAKAHDPQNPYIYLLQGYLTFRRGTTMSVWDALSVIGSSFAMAGQSFTMTADMMGDLKTMKSRDATKKEFDDYADKKAEEYEAKVKQEFGSGNDIIVKKYDPNDFLTAIEIYKQGIAGNPELAMGYYYLGRTYTVLGLYYSAMREDEKAKQYGGLAKEAFKNYLNLNYKG